MPVGLKTNSSQGTQRRDKAPEEVLADVGSDNPKQSADLENLQSTFVIPVIEEHLEVSKELVATGLVRVRKIVHEREVAISEPLATETLHLERVPMNVIVESAPGVRTEGEVTIIPVVEEVLVTTKHLRLVEEVRITKVQSSAVHHENVILRSEEISVERQKVEVQKIEVPNEAGEERPK